MKAADAAKQAAREKRETRELIEEYHALNDALAEVTGKLADRGLYWSNDLGFVTIPDLDD